MQSSGGQSLFRGVLPSELVADHLHVDLLAHTVPQAADEVLINPRFKFTHPTKQVSAIISETKFQHMTYQRVVFESGLAGSEPPD